MTKDEQVYAHFVEANPFPDVEELPDARGINNVRAIGHLQVVGVDALGTNAQMKTSKRRRGLLAVAMLLVLMGMSALLVRALGVEGSAVGSQQEVGASEIAHVQRFIAMLDAGNIDAAIELLDDPLGSIYFPAIDEVTDSAQVADYFEFYRAMGGHTALTNCVARMSGPRTVVTCDADQQVDVLVPIGLEFPVLPMDFEVWDAGIRRIIWSPAGEDHIQAVFSSSRFFEFRDSYLEPRGLVMASGAPKWSKANAERIAELVVEFLAESP